MPGSNDEGFRNIVFTVGFTSQDLVVLQKGNEGKTQSDGDRRPFDRRSFPRIRYATFFKMKRKKREKTGSFLRQVDSLFDKCGPSIVQ